MEPLGRAIGIVPNASASFVRSVVIVVVALAAIATGAVLMSMRNLSFLGIGLVSVGGLFLVRQVVEHLLCYRCCRSRELVDRDVTRPPEFHQALALPRGYDVGLPPHSDRKGAEAMEDGTQMPISEASVGSSVGS